MSSDNANVDPGEVDKFDRIAHRWWDPEGEFKPLHAMNPVRLAFIASQTRLAGCQALDVGCGGGLLTEALSKSGASAIGIDAGAEALTSARLHAHESGLAVQYEQTTAEEYAEQHAGSFDVVTCMELLEHVPDPPSVIGACSRMLRPGGDIFFSTINRNPKSFALAIVAAEYLLKLLPRGSHRYERFIKPSELARAARAQGLELIRLAGMRYDPFSGKAQLSEDVDVNYLVHFRKSG